MFKKLFSFSSKQPTDTSSLQEITPDMLLMLAQVPTAVLVLEPSGKISFANEAAAALLQRKANKLVGINVSKFGISAARLQELLAQQDPAKHTLEIVDTQTSSHSVNAGAKHLGKTDLILLSLEECPQVHHLTQEKEFLENILNTHPIAVTVQDLSGNCVFANVQAQQLFGLMARPAPGTAIYPLLPKGLVTPLQRLDAEVLSGKLPQEPVRLAYQLNDNAERMLAVIKTVLTGEDRKPRFILTSFEEITTHYEWEQDLQRSQKLLEAILNNIPLGIYTRDCDAKVTFINQQGLQILGEQSNTVEKKHQLQTQEEADSYIQRERQILNEGKIYESPQEDYVDSSGRKRIVHTIKVPLKDAGPKPLVLTIVEDVTQRRQQEQEINRVNSFLTAIVQNAPIALYARAESGRMLLRNKQCNFLFGDVREEDFDERSGLPHETQEQVTQYLTREHEILQKGETLDIPEEEYTTPNGETKLLHMVKAPVLGNAPDGRCVITLVEDITAKKAQERELIESKNFLQTVVNQLPVSLSVKNYEGQYILWNKKSEELFGAEAKDVIGKTDYRKDLNKEQAEFVRETDLRVFESRREQNIPQELISSASEGIKIMHTVKTPVFNPDGSPHCLLVVSEDITAKTKMEKQILEARDKNTLLVENAREGVVIIEDGKIIYANHAFCVLLGYETLEDIQGKNLLDFSTENHLVFLKEKYDAVLAGTDKPDESIEAHFVKKDGATVEARFTAVLAKYLGRRIMLGFASDVTVSNRTLRDLKKERDDFRQSFEKGAMPAFILSSKGYITVMNESCRQLLGFSEGDRNFYRNVYLRPSISLKVRKLMREGLPAQMDYVLDLDKAAAKFPQWIHTTGKLDLSVTLSPISKRDTKEGVVEADYLVSLQPKVQPVKPQPPESVEADESVSQAGQAPQPAEENAGPMVSLPPLPPFLTPAYSQRTGQPVWLLPNSEPYAVCDENFMIVECNELFCSLCELKAEELKGQDIRRIFHQDEKPLVDQDFELLKREGKLSNREYSISLASGLETCPVRLTAIKEENGDFLFVLHSLAFHLQIMKILEERSAQLSALRYAVDGAVLQIEWNDYKLGCFTQLNNWLSTKTGYLHEELAQMPFAELFAQPSQEDSSAELLIAQAEKQLIKHGKASLHLPLRKKDGTSLDAQVTLTSLDIPKTQGVLAVVCDLTAQQDAWSKDSREAQELAGLRQSLPGLYLKMDSKGKVLEVFSNLPYMDNAQAQKLFLGNTPDVFWAADTASAVLSTIREALAVRVSSRVEFEWTYQDQSRYFEAAVFPLKKRREVVLWVKDASERRVYDSQVHDLYRLSQQNKLSLTQLVDKALALGKKIFQADIGFVLRFEQHNDQIDSSILYATPNYFRLERHMEFALDDCLRDVTYGSVVLTTDLSSATCSPQCVHKTKHFGSLLAAPIFIDGKVRGALCFASRNPRRGFAPGTEELLGLMSRLLALRIEVREADKLLGDTTRLFTRTLEYVHLPSVIIDPDFQITAANDAFLQFAGQRKANVMGKEFFTEFVRRSETAKQEFNAAMEHSFSDISFRVKLDVFQASGACQRLIWEVFICKNAEGKIEGYALMGQPEH